MKKELMKAYYETRTYIHNYWFGEWSYISMFVMKQTAYNRDKGLTNKIVNKLTTYHYNKMKKYFKKWSKLVRGQEFQGELR